MLTPDYIKAMPENVVKIFEELENEIIRDISKRIAKDIELTATADFRMSQLYSMGYDLKDIEKKISLSTGIAQREVESLLRGSTYLSYDNEISMYLNGGKNLPNFTPRLQEQLKAVVKKTKGDLSNITGSLGVATGTGNTNLTTFYKDTLNKANLQLMTGTQTYQQVIKDAVKTLTDSGVKAINYASGSVSQVDVAVRRAVLTSSSQITGFMSEFNADFMEQDLMEISSHWDARPSHANFQGMIVSRSGQKGYLDLNDIGYGEGWGFKGYNCRHDWYPYFEGISQPVTRPKEPDPIEYNGRTYDSYQASQKQRYHENQMRKYKRKITGYQSAGLTEDAKLAKIKLQRQADEYRKFSEAANIRLKGERATVNIPRTKPTPNGTPNMIGVTKPKRVRVSDYGADYWKSDDYFIASAKYDEDFLKYTQKREEVIQSELNRSKVYSTKEDIQKWAKDRNYIIDPEVFSNLDLEAFDTFAKTIDELMKEYPAVARKGFTVGISDNPIALADASPANKFRFGDTFKNYENALNNYLTQISENQLVTGTGTIKSVYNHEFGHMVDFTIKENIRKTGEYSSILLIDYERDIVKELYEKQGMSVYASTKKLELFAEGFAAYQGGEKTPFAKGMANILKKWGKYIR